MPTVPVDMEDVYRKFCHCMVRVTVERGGDPQCGAAFHIGDGWLVTARHVVQDVTIQELLPHHYGGLDPLTYDRIIVPDDPNIDLALLHTDFDLSHFMTKVTIHGYPPDWKEDHIRIGGHLDDWISDDWLILEPVLLMGYPVIPWSERVLVAMRGEVNAIVDMYRPPKHPHFIISPLARGGFSGGPVLTLSGDLLGVMTESLVSGDVPSELGYGAAITVEPLWDLLIDNGIRPASNALFIRELEDPGSTDLTRDANGVRGARESLQPLIEGDGDLDKNSPSTTPPLESAPD